MTYPDGRRFAFSILDDTDDATLENVRPVYGRLRELGLGATKTVWPEDCPEGSRLFFAADTLARPEYLAFVRELHAQGFEIASHGATMESSPRERTQRGLARLAREFDGAPRLHANHAFNRENLYWGAERFQSRAVRGLLRLLRREPMQFEGEREDSSYFWGDLSSRQIEYVRNFTFGQLDMLRVNREMPYRVKNTPHVRHWFSTTDAPDADAFCSVLASDRIDRLEAAGGVCIVSTHLGKGFAPGGRLRADVDRVLQDIARRAGWFVPVSELLDHLRGAGAGTTLAGLGLARLELRFLLDRALGLLRGRPVGQG